MIQRLDRKLMLALAWATSTKSAFYVLFCLIAVAVIVKPPSDVQGWLLVLVSEFYQGCALPAIGSMSKVEGEATRALLKQIHEENQQELKLIRKELRLADKERKELHELVTYLHKRLDEKED